MCGREAKRSIAGKSVSQKGGKRLRALLSHGGMHMAHTLHNDALRGLNGHSEGSPTRSGEEALNGLNQMRFGVRASV